MAVDWEERVDFDRLRRERLARAKALLTESSMGALLCFDMNNVRYITATHIGTWAQDKNSRFTLLPQNDEPLMYKSVPKSELVPAGATNAPIAWCSSANPRISRTAQIASRKISESGPYTPRNVSRKPPFPRTSTSKRRTWMCRRAF